MLVCLRTGAKAQDVELDVSQCKRAGLELVCDGVTPILHVLDRATLTLEKRQPSHAILACCLEWICLVLEPRDLRLERRSAATHHVAFQVRERDGERLHALLQEIGGADDVSNATAIALRERVHQTNDFVAMLKDSSLVSVLTVTELTKQTQIFATNIGSWLIPGALCAGLYLAMSLPLAKAARVLEERWKAPTAS